MLAELRRVAIIGSARIPFARSNTAYRQTGNARDAHRRDEGAGGQFPAARRKSSAKSRRAPSSSIRATGISRAKRTLGSGLHPHTPAYDVQRACGTSLTTVIQIAHRIALGEIDTAIAGGIGHGERCADRVRPQPAADRARECARQNFQRPHQTVAAAAAARSQAVGARRRRSAHRTVDGRALRADGQGMEYRPKRAGRACARQPQQSRRGVERRFLRRSRRALRRTRRGQQRALRYEPRKARRAEAGVRPQSRRHVDRRQQHAAHRRRGVRAARIGRLGQIARLAGAGVS